MEEVVVMNKVDECKDLPPGFRFHPTDEEIINCYLCEKIKNGKFIARAIGETDLNKFEPWDHPKMAKMGEKEWYFFCQRDRKYPTGMRTNRATKAGYWKATGKDKEIYNKGKGGCLVGMKKTLVFYRGRAPKGEKTNWVMHEYRIDGKDTYYHFPKTAKDEWVVCRIFHKSTGIKRSSISSLLRMNSLNDASLDSTSLPSLLDPNYFNTNKPINSNFIDGNNEYNKGTTKSGSLSLRKSSSTDGSHHHHHHPSYFQTSIDDHQKNLLTYNNYQGLINPSNNINTTPHYIYPNQQIPHPNPLYTFHGSSNSGYLNQDITNALVVPNFPSSSLNGLDQAALIRDLVANDSYGLKSQCKIEKFLFNQSFVSLSQDTGLSTDRNTEISSVVSKHDMGSSSRSNKDMEGPSSGCPVEDLDCLWNY